MRPQSVRFKGLRHSDDKLYVGTIGAFHKTYVDYQLGDG